MVVKNKMSTELILSAITSDYATAAVIFGKSVKEVEKFLKSPKGKAALEELEAIIKKNTVADAPKTQKEADTDVLLEELDAYSFLFPKADRNQATAAFDECGNIRIIIRRDERTARVEIERLGKPLPSQPVAELTTAQEIEMAQRPEPKDEQVAQPEVNILKPQRSVVICLPTNRDFNAQVMLSILGQMKQAIRLSDVNTAKLILEKDTVIDRARDLLAAQFLATNAEWSFWIDSDILAPIGSPGWFHRWTDCEYDVKFAGINALERLTRGPEKLIGAVYGERSHKGRIITQPGLNPIHDGDQELVESLKKKGPRDERRKVDYLGFGCVAVHRDVFTSIQQKFPELAPKSENHTWSFFHSEAKSEDITFCKRAKEAGHQPYLDLAVFCGHVGNYVFMP